MLVCWEKVLLHWRLNGSVLCVQYYYLFGVLDKRSDFQPASIIIRPFNQPNTPSPSADAHKHTRYSPIPRLLPFLPWQLNNENARLRLPGWSEAANDGAWVGNETWTGLLWELRRYSVGAPERTAWKSSLTSVWPLHCGCLVYFLFNNSGSCFLVQKKVRRSETHHISVLLHRRNQIHVTCKLRPEHLRREGRLRRSAVEFWFGDYLTHQQIVSHIYKCSCCSNEPILLLIIRLCCLEYIFLTRRRRAHWYAAAWANYSDEDKLPLWWIQHTWYAYKLALLCSPMFPSLCLSLSGPV